MVDCPSLASTLSELGERPAGMMSGAGCCSSSDLAVWPSPDNQGMDGEHLSWDKGGEYVDIAVETGGLLRFARAAIRSFPPCLVVSALATRIPLALVSG